MQLEQAQVAKRGRPALHARLALMGIRRETLGELVLAGDLEDLSELLYQPWFTHLAADQAPEVMALMDTVGDEHSADGNAIRARVHKLRSPERDGTA